MEAELSNSRRACEPCRRKKIKCSGERPACAFCQRLGQVCTYKERTIRNGVCKDSGDSTQTASRDRIQILESHIEQIYAMLNDNGSTATCRTPPGAVNIASPAVTISREISEQSEVTFHLNQQTIIDAIELYKDRVRYGPMPWVPHALQTDAFQSSPRHLCLSFVALASRLSIDLLSTQARRICISEARREIFLKVTEGDVNLALIQSLCLLIQNSIAESNMHAAWNDISVGARTAIAVCHDPLTPKTESWLQTYWCLWVLDCMYNSSFSMVAAFPSQMTHPPYPRSAASAPYLQADAQFSDDPKTYEIISIDVFCLQLLNIWAEAMTFARTIKDRKCNQIWSASGPYQKVLSEVYDLEVRSGEAYRLRNAKPAERSTSQLNCERHFWALWFMMQILYHAIQALINHPFLHIVRGRGDQTRRPPSFLQHTVDQALLHSSWIAKIISLCEKKNFRLNDPFLAHLASVGATALMFFLDSGDAQLVAQADFGFKTCYRFVQRLSTTWPHLQNTVQKLDILQSSRQHRTSESSTSSACSVQATLLWRLLDYSSSTAPTPPHETFTGTIELGTNTQFLSPLDSVDTEPVDCTTFDTHQRSASVQAAADVSAERIANAKPLDEFNIFSADMFGDFQATSFDPGFWSDFRL